MRRRSAVISWPMTLRQKAMGPPPPPPVDTEILTENDVIITTENDVSLLTETGLPLP